MAKLDRVTAKVFAASAAADEIGQFGSAVAGSKLETSDVATIQGLSAWLDGWSEALISGNRYPALQEMNGLLKVLSYQGAYALQEGIAEYDSATTYYIGSIVKKTGTFELYGSLTDDNLGNALVDGANWKLLIDLANINFTTYTAFSVNSGKVDSDGKPDLLDITDTSKVVFNVDGTTPLKGTLANESLINRTSIDDLSVTALANGIYNLFVGESGACVPLANTIFRQRKEPEETYTSNYTIVGTPTISSDYVVSGFSTSNYLTIPVTASDLNEASSFSIISKFRVTSLSSIQYIFSNVSLSLYCIECLVDVDGTIHFGYSSNGTTSNILISTTTISINTDYYVKVEFTGTAYNLYIGTDKNNLTLDKTTSSTSKLYNNGQLIHLGIRGPQKTEPLSGSLYLKECEVNINGLTYWTIVNPIIEDDIWLDTSVKPFASKKYTGTIWEDFNYIPLPQSITVASGAITAKTLVSGYNINEWDEQIMLPDYNYPTTLTNGALFTAPVDGWVKNGVGMFILYRGSSYTPASTGFSFYPMKGVA